MRFVIVIANALIGGLFATINCWVFLYAYRALVLRGRGSLFDTNPEVANAFFVGWGGMIAMLSTTAAIIASRKKSRQLPPQVDPATKKGA